MIESYKGRALDKSQPVRIRHRTNDYIWSVYQKINGKWLVIGHADKITLRDAKFIVSQKGRKRYLEKNEPHIHTWIEGYIPSRIKSCKRFHSVVYNPFFTKAFMVNGEPIFSAKYVTADNIGVYVHDYRGLK